MVATGNSQIDACQITPANVNGTIAVAASDMSNKFNPPGSGDYELIYEYDNTGRCVDVFAPGVDIMAACGGAGKRYITHGRHQNSCPVLMAVICILVYHCLHEHQCKQRRIMFLKGLE